MPRYPGSLRFILIWGSLGAIIIVPILVAVRSPLLDSRELVYVIGGLAGVLALALLLVQPVLAAGYLPGLTLLKQRRWHRWTGAALIIATALHIGGLYLTSPPDMIDALLLAAPTLYSLYGVLGMWGIVLTALLVLASPKYIARNVRWRIMHNALSLLVVLFSVAHAWMITGAMGSWSKLLLCICILAVTVIATVQLRFKKH